MTSAAHNQPEQLILSMEAVTDGGPVPVDMFVSSYRATVQLMQKSAERIVGEGQKNKIKLAVGQLSHNSPLMAGIRCGPGIMQAHDIVTLAEGWLKSVADGGGEDMPAPELGIIERMVAPCTKKKAVRMRFQRVNGEDNPAIEVTPEWQHNLDRLRHQEMQCHTSIIGAAELVDLHKTPIKLNIYPDTGDAVRCLLQMAQATPEQVRRKALQAIGNRVMVSGVANFRPDPHQPGAEQPYKIAVDVEGIEVLHDDPDAPDILSFKGSCPNITDGKPTLQYLRELRGGD